MKSSLFLLLILLGNTAQSAIAIPEHSALDRQLAALEQQHQGRIGSRYTNRTPD